MDEHRKEIKDNLENMLTHPGWQYVQNHIQEEMKEGLERFIDMPVEKKTSKAAYDMQAKYKVLKNLIEWIKDEIKVGQE